MATKHPERVNEIYLVVWGKETVAVCATYGDAKEYIKYYDKEEEKGLEIKPSSIIKMVE